MMRREGWVGLEKVRDGDGDGDGDWRWEVGGGRWLTVSNPHWTRSVKFGCG